MDKPKNNKQTSGMPMTQPRNHQSYFGITATVQLMPFF
jgi:hypothetical protein